MVGLRVLTNRILVTIAMLWMTQSGFACSCADISPFCKNAPNQQPWVSFGEQAIFVGTAIDVEPDWILMARELWRDLLRKPSRIDQRKARFQVTESFVGPEEPEIEVSTNPGWGGGDCGIRFRAGESYFVVASRNMQTGVWGTSICSRTTLLSYATQDIVALRAWKRGEQLPRRIFGTVDRDSGPRNLVLRSDAATQKISPNQDGHFLIENLASAGYYLELESPGRPLYIHQSGVGRLSGSTDRRPIDLTTARCAELYVALQAR